MKNFIVILFACAAVACPLAAQDNVEGPRNDSANVKDTIVMNHDSYEDTLTKDEDSVKEDNNNGLLIAIFIVSLLSLIVSVLSIIQNKNKMTEKSVKDSNDVEKQLMNMQQQLLQMRKLMEEMLAKQSSLLGEFVTKLGTVQQVPLEQPSPKPYQRSVQQPPTSTTRQQKQIPPQRQTDSQHKLVEPSLQEHTIYVRPSMEGASIVLSPVSEAYADRATFIVKASGNKGTYGFNKVATKSVLSYLDNMLTPYCDCTLLTNGTVSSVNPTDDGTVEKQGDKWVVINKAKVSVS